MAETATRRHDGGQDVYVRDVTIAALWFRLRRGCSFHSLAFNVSTDLSPFERINPYGYRGLLVTQVARGGLADITTVTPILVREPSSIRTKADRG